MFDFWFESLYDLWTFYRGTRKVNTHYKKYDYPRSDNNYMVRQVIGQVKTDRAVEMALNDSISERGPPR